MSAQERLLKAVACLVFEEGTDLLAEALQPAAVAARAGMSRASYYRIEFAGTGHSATRREILEAALSDVIAASAADLQQVVGSIADYLDTGWQSESPAEFIRAATAGNFDAMTALESMSQVMAAALAPSSPRLGQALGCYYETVTNAYTAAYDELFARWGYRVRPPFTTRTFTIAIMALAEGLIMRYCGDEAVDQEFYSGLLAEIGTLMLVPSGGVAETTVPPEHFLPGSERPATRSDIIAAVRRLFADDRADFPTVAEVARAAGCSESVIRNLFGGVRGLVIAAWMEWMPEFADVVERERARLREPDALTLLYRVAHRVAVRALENPELSRALLMSELARVDPSSVSSHDPITELFGGLLREAMEQETFTPPGAPEWDDLEGRIATFAGVLRSNLLGAVVGGAAAMPVATDEQARRCVDYVWAVVFPPRQMRL